MKAERLDDNRRRLVVRVDAEVVDFTIAEAKHRGVGLDLIVEDALRAHRRVVERDRANPRPDL